MSLGASRPTAVGGRRGGGGKENSWPRTPPSFSKTIQRSAQNAPFLIFQPKYPLYRILLHQFKTPSVSPACLSFAKTPWLRDCKFIIPPPLPSPDVSVYLFGNLVFAFQQGFGFQMLGFSKEISLVSAKYLNYKK